MICRKPQASAGFGADLGADLGAIPHHIKRPATPQLTPIAWRSQSSGATDAALSFDPNSIGETSRILMLRYFTGST